MVFTRVSEGETCEAIARDLQARRGRSKRVADRQTSAAAGDGGSLHHIVRARTYLGRWMADKARGLNYKLSVHVPQVVTDDLYARADAATALILAVPGHR